MSIDVKKLNCTSFPQEILALIGNAKIYECSGCSGMKTYFIDKTNGFYLKIGEKESLFEEKIMTEYFETLELHSGVALYLSSEKDYLITKKVAGQSGIDPECLNQPERLAEGAGLFLRALHDRPYGDCPMKGRTEQFVREMRANTEKKVFENDKNNLDFLKKLGFRDNIAAYNAFMDNASDLKDDALIHGDSCLPNLMFRDFQVSGMIDLGLAGIGDRQYDLFWTAWSLFYNLGTRKYEKRFFDAYGRDRVDFEKMRLWAIFSAFGK